MSCCIYTNRKGAGQMTTITDTDMTAQIQTRLNMGTDFHTYTWAADIALAVVDLQGARVDIDLVSDEDLEKAIRWARAMRDLNEA